MKFLLLFLFHSLPAEAHVKWFSSFSFAQAPLHVSDLSSLTFWFLFVLSLLCLPVIVYIDRAAENSSLYLRVNNFLDKYASNAQLIMRITTGAVLLMSWQGDSIIAPEIGIPSPLYGWAQFALIFFLFFKETTWITGLGMVLFFNKGVMDHGIFHMLDYVIYLAVGFYFIFESFKEEKIKNLDLPVLYSGLGFSLCWVAFEKLIYPFWGLSVLDSNPALTMGLDPNFFLTSAAFVEFTLGYLLIICLLQRPLAIVITLVFFTTTAFFGKTEVIGHTIIHGALLVFITKGPGHYYQAPIRFHKSPAMRSLFAIINYIVLFFVMILAYDKLADGTYNKMKAHEHPHYEVTKGSAIPTVRIHPMKDSMSGYNLHFQTDNFTFTPEKAGSEDVPNTGHAHLYVDDKKVARVYGPWFHLSVPKGKHQIRIELTTNSHKTYYYDGKPIEATAEVNEDKDVPTAHIH